MDGVKMKLAVVSDSHDHIWNMRRAVEQANALGVEVMLHCGDLISPFMFEELDAFRGVMHLILGNNPGDQVLLTRSCLERSQTVTLHGWAGRLEIDGLDVAWVHEPDLARSLARSGDYRLVCFGHTHRWHMEEIGETVLLNPGEILGKKEPAGWALVELPGLKVQRILLTSQTNG
jgi:putative phosphoesterase